jgi:hypothetical protein
MENTCCVCELLIAGRKPQFVQCKSCKLFLHRTCLPVALSSTDYVLMKKHNQPFDFQCVKCIGGIIVSATKEPQEKKRRGRPVSDELSRPFLIV